ncbi:MAG: ABC transporter permease [bacterium]
MKKNSNEKEWDLILKPKSGWFDLRLNELWRYRDLISLFVKRDFVALYKQTILGPLWYIIQPLLTTIAFTIVFGNIAKISTDNLPPILFYMAGVVPWNYFAECINKTSDTFISNAQIFGKVYFPRLTVPVSIVISNLITFVIQFLFFLAFCFFYLQRGAPVRPNRYILLTAVLILIMAMLGLGLGIIVSSLTTKYRDLRFLVSFGVQLFMYATPVIYPFSSLSRKYKIILLFNPMTPVIEAFRLAYLGTGSFHISQLSYSISITVIIFIVGILLFNMIEKSFMDTV